MSVSKIPKKQDNPEGLHQRYAVTKIYGNTDSDAHYFVLRIDAGGDDPKHLQACQAAARVYARQIKDHLPQLSQDLNRLLDIKEVELQNRLAANGEHAELTEENITRLGSHTPKSPVTIYTKVKKFYAEAKDHLPEEVHGEIETILTSLAVSAPDNEVLHLRRLLELLEDDVGECPDAQVVWDRIFNPADQLAIAGRIAEIKET